MADKPDKIVDLPLKKIRTDCGTQTRRQLDEARVNEFAEQMQEGVVFDPMLVYFDGSEYILSHGFHRHTGYDRAGIVKAPCQLRQGTARDARIAAYGLNSKGTLPRKREDVQHEVKMCLADFPDDSDREIGSRCGVSHTTVGRIRKALESTGALPQSTERKGKDGRTCKLPERKPSPPVAEREPGDETEHTPPAEELPSPKSAIAAHFDAKENKPASSAAKSTYFDDSQHHRLFGPLMRFYQSRAEVKRCVNCPEHKRADEILGMLQDNFEAWQKRVPA